MTDIFPFGGASGHSYNSTGLPKQFIEERQDVIFRKVRGILNKITPETFDKLSKELVNVGLDSPRTLRGLIYLLFDKALKDLKYSSLYAKLCQELSEKAPNFEQERGPNTFCKFLISKCEDEFERRRKATEDFDGKNELTDEEFEQKAIAKQKMLGNIKFICELGKKRLLQEEILHECIRGLLSKKRERPIQDQAQDLECLCQIMRTIGSLLDIQTSRNLMNQYFERIDMFSKKPELPSRIRFMLRDVIDLRNNNWRPRPFQREDNVPQPLSKLREEAGYDGSSGVSIDKLSNNKNLLGDLSKMHGSKLSSLLIDDEPGFTTTTDFHWGPTFMPHESPFDMFAQSNMGLARENNAYLGKSTVSSSNKATKGPEPIVNSKLNRPITPTNIIGRQQQQFSTAQLPLRISNHEGALQYPFDPFGDFSRNRFIGINQLPASNNHAPAVQQGNHAESRKGIENQRNLVDGRGARNPSSYLFDMNNRDHMGLRNSRLDMESSFIPHFKENYAPPIVNQQPAKPPRIVDQIHSGNSRKSEAPRPYDSPRPPLNNSHRGISPPPLLPPPPPGQRGGHAKRHLHDMPPAPPVVQLSDSNNGSPAPAFGQPLARNQRFDPRNTNLNEAGFNRDDRFGRPHGDQVAHGPRPPKFSGRTYRLPGRDRPPINRDYDDQMLDSDSSTNWRSPKPAQQADNVPASSMAPTLETQNAMKQPVESNNNSPAAKSREVSQATGVNELASDLNSKLNIVAEQRNLSDRHSRHEPSNRFGDDQGFRGRYVPAVSHSKNNSSHSKNNDQKSSASRNSSSEFASSHAKSTPTSRTKAGRDDAKPQNGDDSTAGESQRSTQRGQNGRDNRRHNRGESDRQQHGKQFDRDLNFSLERNYKPAPGRNQSSDGSSNNNLDRATIWRRETLSLVTGGLVNSKDSAANQIGTIFPKTPTKISDANFSLRPSHNLMGRLTSSASSPAVAATATQTTAPTQAAPEKEQASETPKDSPASAVNSDVKQPSASSVQSQPEVKQPVVSRKEPENVHREQHKLQPQQQQHQHQQHQQQQQQQQQQHQQQQHQQQHQQQQHHQHQQQQQHQQHQQQLQHQQQHNQQPGTQRGAARDFHVNKFLAVLSEYSSGTPVPNLVRLAANIKELKVPKNYQDECIVSAIKQSIVRSEADRETASKVLVQLVPSVFDSASLLGAFKTIFEQLHGLEVETPRIKSLVAGFLSRAVFDGLITLEEVANTLQGGKHHPLFLLFLQKLDNSAGQVWLSEKFMASKINLMEMLPEVDRTNERLAASLKDRCLGFLDPMLTVEPDLWIQMKSNGATPNSVYRWIRENVDQTIQGTPTFAHVLIRCLLRYIHNASLQEKANANVAADQQKDSDSDGSSNSSKSSPTTSTSQTRIDKEKELLSKYQQVLQAILSDGQMQLASLYALQSFYHELDFPKGALLRWFHMFYDLNIVDDEVFFIWKEEINDEIPGKGQALFQVNTWLNWLAEAESEEEEEEV